MKAFLIKYGDIVFVLSCLLFMVGMLIEYYITKTPVKLMPY